MIHMILCCQQGASTSLLASEMKNAAKKRGIEVELNAYPYTELASVMDNADIVLFGPQIRYMVKEIGKTLDEKKKPYMLIDTVDYGMLDGEAVLNKALRILKKS